MTSAGTTRSSATTAATRGLDYAYLVEAQAPEFWDDEARKELGL